MQNSGLSDTKPINYNYLTFRLISSVAHQDKVELLKNLERMLLRSMMSNQSSESWIPMDLVQVYKGSNYGRVLSVWYNQMMPDMKYARKLVKTHRFRWN